MWVHCPRCSRPLSCCHAFQTGPTASSKLSKLVASGQSSMLLISMPLSVTGSDNLIMEQPGSSSQQPTGVPDAGRHPLSSLKSTQIHLGICPPTNNARGSTQHAGCSNWTLQQTMGHTVKDDKRQLSHRQGPCSRVEINQSIAESAQAQRTPSRSMNRQCLTPTRHGRIT